METNGSAPALLESVHAPEHCFPSCVITNAPLTAAVSKSGDDAVSANGPPVAVEVSPVNATLPPENGDGPVPPNPPVLPGSKGPTGANVTLPPLSTSGSALPSAFWGTTVTLWAPLGVYAWSVMIAPSRAGAGPNWNASLQPAATRVVRPPVTVGEGKVKKFPFAADCAKVVHVPSVQLDAGFIKNATVLTPPGARARFRSRNCVDVLVEA